MAIITHSRPQNAAIAICTASAGRLIGALNRAVRSGSIAAANEAKPGTVASSIIGAVNEITAIADVAQPIWWRISPFGEFPFRTPEGAIVFQVFDAAAADAVVTKFEGWARKITKFAGLPIYEGHPDYPSWRATNPGVKAAAFGRIKELQRRDDGLYARVTLNAAGTEALAGDAPAYGHQSPHWNMEPITGKPGRYRPYELVSIGLTNTPNLPREATTVAANEGDPTKTIMPPWLIALLASVGIKADSTQADVETAISGLIKERDALKSQLETSKTAQTAAANEAATAKSSLAAANSTIETLKASRANTLVAAKIAAGKLTEAQRGDETKRLAAANDEQFGVAVGELTAAVSAINTAPFAGGRDRSTAASGPVGKIAAINEAVAQEMRTAGVDHSTAWATVKTKKPDLFA